MDLAHHVIVPGGAQLRRLERGELDGRRKRNLRAVVRGGAEQDIDHPVLQGGELIVRIGDLRAAQVVHPDAVAELLLDQRLEIEERVAERVVRHPGGDSPQDDLILGRRSVDGSRRHDGRAERDDRAPRANANTHNGPRFFWSSARTRAGGYGAYLIGGRNFESRAYFRTSYSASKMCLCTE